MLWIHPMFFLPSNLHGVSLVRRAQRWWSGDVRIVKARRRRGFGMDPALLFGKGEEHHQLPSGKHTKSYGKWPEK